MNLDWICDFWFENISVFEIQHAVQSPALVQWIPEGQWQAAGISTQDPRPPAEHPEPGRTADDGRYWKTAATQRKA